MRHLAYFQAQQEIFQTVQFAHFEARAFSGHYLWVQHLTNHHISPKYEPFFICEKNIYVVKIIVLTSQTPFDSCERHILSD